MNELANNATEQKAKFSKLAIASFVLAGIPFAVMVIGLSIFDIDIVFNTIAYTLAKGSSGLQNGIYILLKCLLVFPGPFIWSVMSIIFSICGIGNIIRAKGALRGAMFAELGLAMASMILSFYASIVYTYFALYPSHT